MLYCLVIVGAFLHYRCIMPTELPDVQVIPNVTYTLVTDEELEKPYRVIIENDDVTPMEFVVVILRYFFGLTIEQASGVMLEAHQNGRALVATMPYQEAQERVYDAHSAAREAGYPLSFYLEPDQ